MRAARILLTIAAIGGSLTSAAGAQMKPGTDSEAFLEAVREQRNNEVVDMVAKKGVGIVNYRGYDGSTPLTIAVSKRAQLYINFLLQNRADPNLPNKSGDTPLMIAARSGYLEGMGTLIDAGASVNKANRMGETALIIAVQGHQLPSVRRLLEAGADPLHVDNASGLSARDYAARDRRSSEMLRLIDSVKPKTKVKFIAGPIIK